ncbi:hypothetical protein COCCADRAFT_31125 [Bipolaris zeicola 26-R-13]|uniref:Uncharacterized protein n=1 Tax=Cochliobolus carbonum (strain 26-R-13) TaxID=930089 RepID=W6XPD7_COCC2|nr:uncharacterized protein COCCADRAFT_31125 [Bipolaris zeicola 26-R-13]EUC27388.1 hypothetical protein COCCADRAFT_31125 [Bipolaris zeicola 26-R-13]
MDFSSIMEYWRERNISCGVRRLPGDSAWYTFSFTGSRRSECKVLPPKLQAATPVGAARMTTEAMPRSLAMRSTLAHMDMMTVRLVVGYTLEVVDKGVPKQPLLDLDLLVRSNRPNVARTYWIIHFLYRSPVGLKLGGRGGLGAPLSQKDSLNQGHGPSQLTAELEAAQDSNSSSHGAYPSNQQGDFGHVGSLVVGSSGSGSDDDYLAWFRQRKTSISFNDESQSRHPGNGSYSDEHDYLELPYAARRGMQYRICGSRFPHSQAPIDGLARNNEYPDQVAALTSDATALLGLDGTYRKRHPGLGSSYQTALAPHLAHGVVAFVTSSWIEAMQG